LWTLTHHRDFARGFVGLLGHPYALGEVFHITGDEWLSWNEIFKLTAQAAGVEAKVVHAPSDLIAKEDPEWGAGLLGDKAYSMMFDNTKIRRLVPDFSCPTPFAQGIREVIGWYRADPKRQVVDGAFNERYERILARMKRAWA
jgi:nucleoside-diphosphate-sugar epimerase